VQRVALLNVARAAGPPSSQDWASLKRGQPWLTVPVLELPGGERVAQTHAILRLIGSQTSPRLYPEDALAAARVDELMDAVNDIQVAVNGAGSGLEGDAKLAARKEAIEAGVPSLLLANLDGYIAKHGSGGHAVGSGLTIADLKIFTSCTFIASGFFDGIPPTAMDGFSHIKAVCKTVASLPVVQSYYDARAADGSAAKFEESLVAARK